MTKPGKIFHQIATEVPNAIEGKMFGAKCIKATNGKTAAFFWEGNMVFKLDEKSREEALKLNGAKTGSHLYAPDRQMKGWISIPAQHSDEWTEFAVRALKHVNRLKK